MRINHNISAVITNKQLLRTEDTLADSMERLSSGLKINHAKDNPSGMAISGKMQAQIDGLDQASQNSSDGISVLETADGALGEVSSIIQRMRELAVQAANDTNSDSDKAAIQTEIASLKEEIDRISSTTEFNTKGLLDGSLDARVYADRQGLQVSRTQVSEQVSAGTYAFTVDSPATQATANLGAIKPITGEKTITINGAGATLTEDMSDVEIYEALREAAEKGDCTIDEPTYDNSTTPPTITNLNSLSVSTKAYGANAELTVNPHDGSAPTTATGSDAEITIDTTSDFSNTTTYKLDGNKVTFTNTGGFEMSMVLDAGQPASAADPNTVSLEVTDIGPMDLQIGANEGQQMSVRIPSMDLEHLYLDDIDVSTKNGPSRAIARCDEALAQVNKVRASLGAYENRLEHTVASLDTTEENMTSAISRIGDVDMAEEMVEYTKDNVLAQAGTSALSQANELPQMALQLLG